MIEGFQAGLVLDTLTIAFFGSSILALKEALRNYKEDKKRSRF